MAFINSRENKLKDETKRCNLIKEDLVLTAYFFFYIIINI